MDTYIKIMEHSKPAISVIMSVYNGEAYLVECLDSILTQTFKNFELVIVNDASSDNTLAILEKYKLKDSRIVIINNKFNEERALSRNTAISHAKASLLAVMDADDVCPPKRLQLQFEFMTSHPEVSVCGGAYITYETGNIWHPPLDNSTIRTFMLFDNPLAHSATIMRKHIIESVGGYDVNKPPTEDFDLWVRLSKRPETIFANIPDILLIYRTNPVQNRIKYFETQTTKADEIIGDYLKILFPQITNSQIKHHTIALRQFSSLNIFDMRNCMLWYAYLCELTNKTTILNKTYLYSQIQNLWFEFCKFKLSKEYLIYYILFLFFQIFYL